MQRKDDFKRKSIFTPPPPPMRKQSGLLVLALMLFLFGTLTGCNMGGDDDDDGGSSFPFQSDLKSLPRAIFLTDPELDDFNSMEHMLLYSNNINLVGLIYQSSMHWRGTQYKGGTIPPGRWPAEGDELHIDQAINLYEEVYPNLVRHDSNYPSPAHLRSITKWGNTDIPGDYSEFTEGAQLIYDILMDDKPQKVFVGAWGGMSTLAAAINRLPTDQATKTKIANKLVVTAYGFQDRQTVGDTVSSDNNATVFRSIINYSPDIEYREESSSTWGYFARGGSLFGGLFQVLGVRADQQFYLQPGWMQKNVSRVGPMGQAYRLWGNGRQMAPGDVEDYFWLCQETDESKLAGEGTWLQGLGYMVWIGPYAAGSWISEGDSGNWALLVDNGLRAWEGPNYGGWGGRHEKNTTGNTTYGATNMWSLVSGGDPLTADGTRSESVYSRWFNSIMDGFATRLQWTIKSPGACNHEPTVRVTNNITNDGTLNFTAVKGATVTLTAEIYDRDGDGVWLSWWEYQEADSYASVVGAGGTSKINTFTIPQDANSGDTIHIIAEAKDSGSPSLTSWQRVVITVE